MKKLIQLALISTFAFMLQGCIPAAIVGGTAVASKVITDPRTMGHQLDDESLEEQVMYAINKDPQLKRDARINAVSYNNEVFIVGQVPSEALKQQVTNIVRGVNGVKTLYNELTIRKKITATQVVKDATLTSQIKSKLLMTANIRSNNVKVFTENSNVYLMGVVTPQEATRITHTVRNVEGVKKVINAMKLIK